MHSVVFQNLVIACLLPICWATLTLTCPDKVNDSKHFSLLTTTEVKTGNFPRGLCTLAISTPSSPYIPVSRSYLNKNWERSGGGFAAVSLNEWKCRRRVCTTKLPPGNYTLKNVAIRSTGRADTWARFLESATFGASSSDLVSVSRPTIRNLANYMKDQMLNHEPTSHREFYRKRLNAIQEFHYPMYATKSNPCVIDSHWSRQYLSVKDIDKDVVVKKAGDFTEIYVDKEKRAVLNELRYELTGDRIFTLPFGTYTMCGGADKARRGYLQLILVGSSSGCYTITKNDTMIDFVDGNLPSNVIEGDADLTDTNKWNTLPSFHRSVPMYQRLQVFTSPLCRDSINPTEPIQIDIFAESSGFPPVFHKTRDGQWLLHKPIVNLLENSVGSPHPLGGKDLWEQGRTQHCSNVARNFLNEDSCVASTSSTCLSGTDDTTSTVGVVCGSIGEVSNDASLGDNWLEVRSMTSALSKLTGLPTDVFNEVQFTRQREQVWYEIALKSKDQLRQRMAWALKQMFSLPKSSIRSEKLLTEAFTGYYDIFVRNAFGNYRDILREITYNPLMAESLSFDGSRSLASRYWNLDSTLAYPDENFARELMQLFTIGLVELNPDGTPVQDSVLGTIPTYDSDDIANFARAWTGFVCEPLRSNMENPTTKNQLDPMTIIPEDRDRFPKTNLEGGYIGDVYPLCVDIPERPYLRVGAKYRLLGKIPLPELVSGDNAWTDSIIARRAVLHETTPLYAKLCVADGSGRCTYPSVVVLDENLSCPDCKADQLRVVKVEDYYYEYVPVPCVEQSFFEQGKVTIFGENAGNRVCVDKRLSSASEACCDADDLDKATPSCDFAGERMKFETANARCTSDGKTLCTFREFTANEECPHVGYHWSPDDCRQRVKINQKGYIAVIHDVARPHRFIREDLSPNFFKVYWKDSEYPAVGEGCGDIEGCREVDDDCICDVGISEEAVFTTIPSSATAIKSELSIGFPDIAMFDTGSFQETQRNGYKSYSKDGTCCDANTVFSVESNGVTKLYKNIKSTVQVTGSSFEFRNSPSFNSLVPTEFTRYSAEYETEAVLDHFFYHKNTAPFVAYRIIQRFGISNPSPRYVKVVANAFRSGSVRLGGVQFGSGKYGDLAATVARALLDHEARSNRLLSDPSMGSSREPVVKVVGLMRAMELESSVPLLDLDLLDVKIGQAPYEQPSVFNFFRPEYSPPGVAASATLVSPEAEVLSTGKVVGLLNGMFSIFKYGLENCGSGFGSFGCHDESNPSNNVNSGSFSLQYRSSLARFRMLRSLSRVLTAGRLSTAKQNLIRAAVTGIADHHEAMHKMAQFIVTTPEFHTTTSTTAPLDRATEEYSEPTASRPNDGYKAIIHISLRGGCDSFNMLMPHTSCGLYDNYKAVRDTIAINPSDTLPIQATGQPCSTFGVHEELSRVQNLYNHGQLLFFANAGVLTKPVTKDDYKTTRTNLFAHNSMQGEVDTLDPFNTAAGTGTLGRLADALEEKGYKVGRTSVESGPINLSGMDGKNSPVSTLDESGVQPFDNDFSNSTAAQLIAELNGQGAATGVHGELWSTTLSQAVNQSNTLYYILDSHRQEATFADTRLGRRMRLISQLIETRVERDVDRDVFYVTLDGFDHHSEMLGQLKTGFRELNNAIGNLVDALGPEIWKDVAIVQTSDFGRTLTPNSNAGSDHGWGGNYFMTGGSVKGKQIKGDYPTTFDETGPQNVGQGRLIPTTPFDAYFNGVAEWVGIDSAQGLDSVLPNRNNFDNLFTADDLFKSG